MKTSLVRIGNSQGIRIPKAIIDQCGFEGEVEIAVKDRRLVIAAARVPRSGWSDAFRAMALAGDDELLLPDNLENEFDRTEWEW